MTGPSPSSPAPGRARSLVGIAVFLAIAVLSSFVAWADAFGTLTDPDDPGYLLITLRQSFAGRPLYDEVFSHYGPFYYLVHAAIYAVLGWPVDHASIRWISIFLMLVASSVGALFVRRATGSAGLAGIAHAAFLRLLACVAFEAGHPQAVVAVLVSALLVLETVRGRPRPSTALRGAIVVAAALTKVNVGVFLAVAILVTAEPALPFLGRAFRLLAPVLAVALPFAVMRPFLSEPWARDYAAFVALSMLGVAVHVRDEARGRLDATALGLGGLTAGAAACGYAFVRGTTLHGLLDPLVFQPLRLSKSFYVPPGVSSASLIWAILAIAPTVAAVVRPTVVLSSRARALARVALGVAATVLVFVGEGTDTSRPAVMLLFGTAPPLAWLVLEGGAAGTPGERLGAEARARLAWLAVVYTLIAFPTAGAQLWLAAVPLLALALVAAADGAGELARAHGFRLEAVTVAVALGLHALLGVRAHEKVKALVPLRLPGSAGVLVTERQAATWGWLSHNLEQLSDTFVSLPGLNSLYFFARKEPPTALNTTVWMTLLDDERQARVASALATHPRACAVRNLELTAFWLRKQDVRSAPLVAAMREAFVPVASVGGFDLMVRRGRTEARRTFEAGVLEASGAAPAVAAKLRLTLPALGEARVERVAIAVADGPLLFDTVPGAGEIHVELEDGSPVAFPWPVSEERVLVLRAAGGADLRRRELVVVRLLAAGGEVVATVPIVGP